MKNYKLLRPGAFVVFCGAVGFLFGFPLQGIAVGVIIVAGITAFG